MTRLIRDFVYGLAFGLGMAVARIFAVPLLLIAGALAAWAGGWAGIHHLSFVQGIQHVEWSVGHLLARLGVPVHI